MIHPTLFKKTATGAMQSWSISTEDNTIVTRWGQVGGAMQEGRDVVTEGKNLGKKNESTPAQQAALEAEAQWTKKLKRGYVQNVEAAEVGEVDEIITGGVAPMLAFPFDKQGHKLKYPCYVQPKLDGHRCIAVVEDDGSCTLWSRTRKPILSMPHIARAVEDLGLSPGTVLDGELYNHEYKDKFEQLTSYIRASEPRSGGEVVEYHVYDIASDGAFVQRAFRLASLAEDLFAGGPLVYVETVSVDNEDELMIEFTEFLDDGYEGAIARNYAGLYANKRSPDLLKIKEFLDSEFEVVGVEEGRGKLAGHAIFVCKTIQGAEFRAKLIGETAALKQYFENPALAIGRALTVKYQGLTTKNGVPRFPVAVRFREDV